jgi:transposase
MGWQFYRASEPAYQLDPGHPKQPRWCQGPQGLGARCGTVNRGCPASVAQPTKGAKDVLDPRCAGRDVHKDTVVACVRVVRDGAANSDVRTVDTTTPRPPGAVRLVGGERLDEINRQREWKPVWHILADGDVTLILANAAHVKTVPGRNTDVADASRMADLLAHGPIRASVVPETPLQEMRALRRAR